MKIAKPINSLIESFQRLPGIGPKTAERLTFYLLRVPQSQLDDFAQSLSNLKKNTILCSVCKNVSEADPCLVCSDIKRDKKTIMVIEEPLDILVFEKTAKFFGVYHVLHGVINPLENIGPDELYMEDLFKRAHDANEIIIATNPTMEGEATSMYITKKLHEQNPNNGHHLKITRLGMGIPTGADLGYADPITLTSAIEGRREI
ncbi:recombination protein RecR [Candidatus Woesebacteria bacterium]|nr:recombination protein RecR [Candidatus Woesebacteria bacterium]QQG47383.1 MAG: recombination protein RecR [Candidatus Woesebacteria bacterium]